MAYWCCSIAVHIILFVVVFLVMVPLVVDSLLMLIILLVMQTWALVLLYHLHCTHYTLRGRDSYGRQFCGCWIVSFNSDYSYNVWLIGAALSRVHIMLNVAVFLEIKFSVVLLMFLLLIFILMLSGVLVLL